MCEFKISLLNTLAININSFFIAKFLGVSNILQLLFAFTALYLDLRYIECCETFLFSKIKIK